MSSRAPNRPRRASAPQQGSRTPPAAQTYLDFNALWSSRDLTKLDEIPRNERGWCSCRLCGRPSVVKGSLFRQHMLEIHAPLPSPKRQRPKSLPVPPRPAPSSPLASTSRLEAATFFDRETSPFASTAFAPVSGLQLEMMDLDEDAQVGNEDEQDEEEARDEAGLYSFEQAQRWLPTTDDPLDDLAEAGKEGQEMEEELSRLVEQVHLPEGIVGNAHLPSTPSPGPSLPRPSADQLSALARGSDIPPIVTNGQFDFVTKWPHPLPRYLLPPPASGSQPNPFETDSVDEHADDSVFNRTLPLLAHTLLGYHNISRRAAELVLRVASSLVWHTKLDMYERFKAFYVREHPNADDQLLSRMEEGLAPSLGEAGEPRTIKTALRRLRIDNTIIVHPVCRNHSCNHVFYNIIDQPSFAQLPVLCPSCQFPTREALHFPRRTLQSELEVVLNVPGVEDAIEKRDERKATRDARDELLGGGKIFRQQDDGSAWHQRVPVNAGEDFSITVNLGLDWASASTHRSAAASSMGPITMQVADLPTQLRSSFTCSMLLGITPAPKQPSGANLFKFLVPLVLELRDAEASGVWVKTPKFPNGRLVKVYLGCLCCDRPAACEISGGPNFKRADSPCLRCMITLQDVASLSTFPPRSSSEHDHGIIDQLTSVPIALQADRDAYEAEPPINPVTGEKKKSRYLKKRFNAALDAASPIKGNLSPLCLIVGFDKFPSTIFDPMHLLLEGCCKTYFFKVMQAGAHTATEEDEPRTTAHSAAASTAGSTTGSVTGSTAGTNAVESSDRRGKAARGTKAMREAQALLTQLGQGEAVTRPVEVVSALQRGLEEMAEAAKSKGRRTKKVRMTEDDIVELQSLISAVTVPSSVVRLHPHFGTASAGTPSANDWRAFSTVYAPLSLPSLYFRRTSTSAAMTEDELHAQMMLCELVHLALRSSISETQVAQLEGKIVAWQKLVFRLHPTLVESTNFHVIAHIGEDIRAFGPVYGYWSFLIERINHIIKSTNRSGGSHRQAQVVAMRAAIRSRDVVSARSRSLMDDSTPHDTPTVEQQLAAELRDLFEPSSRDTPSSVLDQISAMYTELDRQMLDGAGQYSAATVAAQRRGKKRETVLGNHLRRKLQDCLEAYGQATSLSARDAQPYLSPIVTEWESMIFAGRRLDAAEWAEDGAPNVNDLEAARLAGSRNSLFEARPGAKRYRCEDVRVATGVLSRIFEHTLIDESGTATTGLYAVIRRFKPQEGSDVYGYRRYPALDAWTWEANVLRESTVIALKSNTLDSMRPLALAVLPAQPSDEANPATLWATLPVHHH